MLEFLIWADFVYGVIGILLTVRFVQIARGRLPEKELMDLAAIPLLFSLSELVKFSEKFGVLKNTHEILHILLVAYLGLLFYRYLMNEKKLEEALLRIAYRAQKLKSEIEEKPL